MATVKILYDSEASHLENYLKRHQEKEMLTTERGCTVDGVAQEFADIQRVHGSKGNNSIHLIQSWSPKESALLTKEQVHAMGMELASRFAPGHQFVVQTHDDEPHLHNHIMINPVSLETGKRIQNKLENIRTVRNHNDDIARENGLQVLPPQEKLTRPGPNERSNRIEAYRGRSYILDLSRKARFARSHATNYDEYLSLLGAFDIKARVEAKNITYFYPGHEHGKRGKNLDPDLDKSSLERKFVDNLERIKRHPELRQSLSEILKGAPESHANQRLHAGVSAPISRRRDEKFTEPRSSVLEQSLIPIEAFHEAKTRNILEYCEREKIALKEDASGRTVLKARESLEVTAHSWINHKNKTQGNIIDFVANHREVGIVHAVSILTDNPKLLLLERYAGKETFHYRPFYIPENDAAPRGAAIRAISKLANGATPQDEFSDLFKQQRVQVSKSGTIRFFSERDSTAYAEYLPDTQGQYQQKLNGSKAAFVNRIKGARAIELYTDPRSLLIHRPDALSSDHKAIPHTLTLFEANIEAVHRAIAGESTLSRITLIGASDSKSDPKFQSFFDELSQSLNPFSIDVALAWEPPSQGLSILEAECGIDLGRGREISFFKGG